MRTDNMNLHQQQNRDPVARRSSQVYAKVVLPHRGYGDREREILNSASLSTISWQTADEKGLIFPSYHSPAVLPWALAKLLLMGGSSNSSLDVIEVYNMEEIEWMSSQYADRILFNEYSKACVPSDAVMRVRVTKLLEDCCTDMLQEHLNEGWSILAVCPQASRRPDYVLGKIPPPVARSLPDGQPVGDCPF